MTTNVNAERLWRDRHWSSTTRIDCGKCGCKNKGKHKVNGDESRNISQYIACDDHVQEISESIKREWVGHVDS